MGWIVHYPNIMKAGGGGKGKDARQAAGARDAMTGAGRRNAAAMGCGGGFLRIPYIARPMILR